MIKRNYLLIGGIILSFTIAIIILLNYLVYNEELIEVDADPQQGFNYGYYLYIPNDVKQSEVNYLLVEPNNTGKPSDDSTIHKKAAKKLIKNGVGNYISKELKIPLLVPLFDRPMGNVKMYTHSLDSDTLKNNEGQLARIDLQLLHMIEDAKKKLLEKDINLKDKVFLHGFSASGSFTNRFTALHPEIVKAVSSGGVNSMPIIPAKEWDGKELPYHVGIANIKNIAGIEFNLDEYKRVAQYIFMGELDENDTLPYSDAFNPDERIVVKEVLGQEMQDRWEKSKRIYNYFGIPAQMVKYKGIDHTITLEIKKDIVNFLKLNSGKEIKFIIPYEY